MKLGLTRIEVMQLLGSSGHAVSVGGFQPSDGPPAQVSAVWQYNWYGGGFLSTEIHDAAYVVWFDNSGHVSAFRPPVGSDENRGGQLRSTEETEPADESPPER